MPYRPTAKKKPWHEKRVVHQRVKDMRWFYNSRTWRKFSANYKTRNPLCVQCESEGIITEATVTDHIYTYEKCPEGFNLDNLEDKYVQGLCKRCHDKKSGREAHQK